LPSSAPARPLLLLHLLAADGVESVALETRSREYVAARIRAGVLETSTAGSSCCVRPGRAAALAPALAPMINKSDHVAADGYSERALRRVWRCTHFSWWMTTMLHTQGDDFDAQLQKSQLDWVTSSAPGSAGLAENYAACQSAIDTDREEPVDASV
jgi:hypothetical protein